MKKLWLLAFSFALIVLSAPIAQAVECSAVTHTGTDITFANLVSAGTCTIGDKTFSGFNFLGGDIAPSTITVDTVNMGNSGIGFVFAFNLSAGPGTSSDVSFQYNVAAPGATIIDVHVLQTGSAVGGNASVGETLCIGGIFNPGCTSGNTISLQTSIGDPQEDRIFGPVSLLGVRKDIVAIAFACPANNPGCNNFASISVVENTVTQTVPEAGTLLLLGSGLVGVATWSRRKFRK